MEKENKKLYTKLTLEIQYPDDNGPVSVELTEPRWDMDSKDIIKMLHRVLAAHGWQESGFKKSMEQYMEYLLDEEG